MPRPLVCACTLLLMLSVIFDLVLDQTSIISAQMSQEIQTGPGEAQTILPAIDTAGSNLVCETWINLQLMQGGPTKGILVAWGEAGEECFPSASGPLGVECTGLLGPGGVWMLLGAQIPEGTRSGILFSVTAKRMSEVGIPPLAFGDDDIVADVLCEMLSFFKLSGDADEYRGFKRAFDTGSTYNRLPLDRVYGAEIAATVHRECESGSGQRMQADYVAVSGAKTGSFNSAFSDYGYIYTVPSLRTGVDGIATTVIHAQNVGLTCLSFELRLRHHDHCLSAMIDEVLTLAPGERREIDIATMVGSDWNGSAMVRSSQPLAIVVDTVALEAIASYANQSQVSTILHTSLAKDGEWERASIEIYNHNVNEMGLVQLNYLSEDGAVLTSHQDWVCPNGGMRFDIASPENWSGAIRVKSLPWLDPDPLPGQTTIVFGPQPISAIATTLSYSEASQVWLHAGDASGLDKLEVVANDTPRIGGDAVLAIPELSRSSQGSSTVYIQNAVTRRGYTEFAVYIYDQNGLLDYMCDQLQQGEVQRVELAELGTVPPSFMGNAVVSAGYWEHYSPDSQGQLTQNKVDLTAVVRSGQQEHGDIGSYAARGFGRGHFAPEPSLIPPCPPRHGSGERMISYLPLLYTR